MEQQAVSSRVEQLQVGMPRRVALPNERLISAPSLAK